mgnify:CR=1 FL=1
MNSPPKRTPYRWYVISPPPLLRVAEKYAGTFSYEATNGVVRFSVTRAGR